jgi:hypothetical protein
MQAQTVSLMAAPGVVVPDVLGHDDAGVPFAGDEHAVGALGPGRADEPLGDRVHPRRLRRGRDHFDPAGGEGRVERGGELGVSVPDQVGERAPGIGQVGRALSRIPTSPKGAELLGDWEAGSSDVTFGRDGKPFYINGLRDDTYGNLAKLRRAVGGGNFDYLIQFPGPAY